MQFGGEDAQVLERVMRWRRDVRHFRPDPIPEPVIDELARAMELARSIARHSPTAVARTRAAIWASKELPLGAALEHGWHYIQRQNDHPDVEEGVAAFLAKRPPNWRDREPGDID